MQSISIALPCLSFVHPRLSLCLFRYWLLAKFVDGPAPSACVVRRPYGSTMCFSTMSCVYSTHHFLPALNSFPSLFQRISLAQENIHFFLLLFLSPLFLRLSRLLRSPLLLHAPPSLSFLPLHFLSCSLSSLCSRPIGFSLINSSCPVLLFRLFLSLLPPFFRRSHSQPVSSFWSLSFLGPTWPGSVSHQPPC